MNKKGKNPKVTVYVVSHNYCEYLQDAIESVLRQNYDDWELLIIDDNSTDKTPEVANLYSADPRVKYFRTKGIGLPSVCNLALREARGEYIIRLDGDDIFDENMLLVLAHHLDSNKNLALVFPDYFLIDEHGDVFAHERRRKLYTENHQLDVPANGACALARIKILRESGGYREDLGAQDGFDMWTRLMDKHKFANVNLPLFYYRRHHSNLTNNANHILAARRRVKRDSILDDLSKFKPFTAVIPCRKRYDFCEDVWKLDLNGVSLLQKSIETHLSSSVFENIIIASDNPEVKDVISMFDDKRLDFFQRHTKDTIRSQKLAVTLDKILAAKDPAGEGVTVVSYAQAPFVSKDTLEESVFTLVMNQADSSIGVEEIKNPIYKRTPHGLQSINPQREFSTDFDTLYRETNTVMATRNKNFKKGSLTGPSVVHFLLPVDEGFFISSEKDLKIAGIMEEG